MNVIDLTQKLDANQDRRNTAFKIDHTALKIEGINGAYTGNIYDFQYGSMSGTYIDFPGHISETDDGQDAANYPAEKLYRVKSAVIHLDREKDSGEVKADELEKASPDFDEAGGLILNAIGERKQTDVGRSVYLGNEALEWIISKKIHLIVSDVYESNPVRRVFGKLFENGISTVCCPANLPLLKQNFVELTVLPLRMGGVTQLPCRVLAGL